jgi:hypothetical protein
MQSPILSFLIQVPNPVDADNCLTSRNLRLPAHTLYAGQVGTLGLKFDSPNDQALLSRVKKGMIAAVPGRHMAEASLQAATGFTACFEDVDINSVSPGSLVVVYIGRFRGVSGVKIVY